MIQRRFQLGVREGRACGAPLTFTLGFYFNYLVNAWLWQAHGYWFAEPVLECFNRAALVKCVCPNPSFKSDWLTPAAY